MPERFRPELDLNPNLCDLNPDLCEMNPDLCDLGAVQHKLSYQANLELAILWVHEEGAKIVDI